MDEETIIKRLRREIAGQSKRNDRETLRADKAEIEVRRLTIENDKLRSENKELKSILASLGKTYVKP